MKRTTLHFATAALGLTLLFGAACAQSTPPRDPITPAMQDTATPNSTASSIYEFTMKDIDGKDVPLSQYKGKVLLVVNVASFCGNTPQYEALEKLYEQNKDKGLVVLGFPANEFGQQEPGSNAEIKTFCTSKYNVTFPMFSKIVVKGEGEHPLYKWLTQSAQYHDDIEWNFGKFVVGRDGKVVKRFNPKVKPDSPDLEASIQEALATQK
jgi:glutathione peroxidase